MSLFKSREWWSVNLNENEMYDSQCLLIFNLEKDLHHSILIGSHEGFLRLFSPLSEIVDGVITGYKPLHLLLEVQLPFPILQINEGILVSGSKNKHVAVLHPRLFSVYAFKKNESKESKVGDQVQIELAYQHVLRHSAHSFVLGPFGGVRGRHFICIQSLDGLLSFYEQESFAFQLYLPNFLLPSPFAYLEKIDSFLFLNGSLTLNCYSYEALASIGNSNEKKMMETWDYNLGEGILEMKTIIKNGLVIVILSERNLLGLNENGRAIFMKRLDYKPVTFCPYVTEENQKLMIIIITDEDFLNLYEETVLKWSMKIEWKPVAVNRIHLSNLPGGIVFLSENGFLQCVYMGTHPSVYLVPPLVQPELNVQKAELELKQLQQKILENDSNDPIIADAISVDVKTDKTIKIENDVRMCSVIVVVSCQCSVNRAQILIVVEPPLSVSNPSTMIATCSEETLIESYVYPTAPGIVSNLEVLVTVSYITSEGGARSIQKTGILPLGLVLVETPPAKEAQHKITITTNKPVCSMSVLFKEFATEETSQNAIGLKFVNSGDDVTILAAKASQRYRLQSDSMSAITLPLSILLEKLTQYFRKESDFTITYSMSLPLDVYFDRIERHHGLINKRKLLEEKLSKETCQYRTVQKKILSNLKDATPKPASNLNKVLKDTFRMVLSSIQELEKVEEDLFVSRCWISSLSRLLVILLEAMSVGSEDLPLLKTVFSPNMHDTDEQGWLEVQEATSSFLLRTTFAKSVKDQQKSTEIILEPLKDASKLIKHFGSVIDRVTKGSHLLERNEFESSKGLLATIQRIYESEESFLDDPIPAASKFVQLESADKQGSERCEKKESDTVTVQNDRQGSTTEERMKETSSLETVTKTIEEPKVEMTRLDVKMSKPEPERKETETEVDYDDDDDAIWDVRIEEMEI